MADARVERLVTAGTFSLGDGARGVERDVWVIGGDEEVIVVDAVPALAARTGVPILPHAQEWSDRGF
ncbi:hypothetical protein ACFWDQ_41810 [Streptomyces sp. NPDC060053]|uniref:hypothetical protein n=1 Tax=Streptomyces sp. NPDC060053 TaxID=3347047 RepID=UPI003694F482